MLQEKASIAHLLDLRPSWACGAKLCFFSAIFGKRLREVACASDFPASVKALPSVSVLVENEKVQAMVDSGCTKTIVARRLARNIHRCGQVIAVDGSLVACGMANLEVVVNGIKLVLQCLVLDDMVKDFELILGMDVIKSLGGVRIDEKGVQFGGGNWSTHYYRQVGSR